MKSLIFFSSNKIFSGLIQAPPLVFPLY